MHAEIMAVRSNIFRLRALAAEKSARESNCDVRKMEWEQIAIEWHAMASREAERRRHLEDQHQVEFA
jgi:hypothetical protein